MNDQISVTEHNAVKDKTLQYGSKEHPPPYLRAVYRGIWSGGLTPIWARGCSSFVLRLFSGHPTLLRSLQYACKRRRPTLYHQANDTLQQKTSDLPLFWSLPRFLSLLSFSFCCSCTRASTSTVDGSTAQFGKTGKTRRDVAADIALQSWISTGRAPQRKHLIWWLLQRLELVENTADVGAEVADKQEVKRWLLVISTVHGKDSSVSDDHQRHTLVGVGDIQHVGDGRVRQGRRAKEREIRVENKASPKSELALQSLNQVEAQEERWWDIEDPWEQGPTPTTIVSGGRSVPPPPAYRESAPFVTSTTLPPPYEEVVRRTSRLPDLAVQNKTVTAAETTEHASTRPASDDAASANNKALEHPPPSYHTTSGGGSVSSERENLRPQQDGSDGTTISSTGRYKRENGEWSGNNTARGIMRSKNVQNDVPAPPSYRQFYDDGYDPNTFVGHNTDIVRGSPPTPTSSSWRGARTASDTARNGDERHPESGRKKGTRRRQLSGEHRFGQRRETPETDKERLGWSRRMTAGQRSSTATGGRPKVAGLRELERKETTSGSSLR